jgi:hypothetical protein
MMSLSPCVRKSIATSVDLGGFIHDGIRIDSHTALIKINPQHTTGGLESWRGSVNLDMQIEGTILALDQGGTGRCAAFEMSHPRQGKWPLT